MTLEQALEWAEKNCSLETNQRLRSRAVVAFLADEVRRTRTALKKLAHLEGHYAVTPEPVLIARVALGCKRSDK